MYLSIGGVDITKYIAENGFKRTRNDIDGWNAGRTLDGVMHRDRVATKIKLEITTTRMTKNELSVILNAIYPVNVSVTYDDPREGRVTKTMYSNNNPAVCFCVNTDGVEIWDSISFPLIEV